MHICFFSSIGGNLWGGSEELWTRAADVLLREGHRVSIISRSRRGAPPQIEQLRRHGAQFQSSRWRLGRDMQQLADRCGLRWSPFRAQLRRLQPDLLVVSLGGLLSDLSVIRSCWSLGIPYALLLQSASPHLWIKANQVEFFREAYRRATQVCFVSEKNRQVVEDNLSLDLSAAKIVDNPFNVPVDAKLPWPTGDGAWKLACVARICFQAKAQDVILRVLDQPKWRGRPIEVSLFGHDGGNLHHLLRLIQLRRLEGQVRYCGFAPDVLNVWRSHHGLLLPSRFEGNALAMIEAMVCGRVPIVTDVGRATELIDDGASGFVAPAATAALVDAALERAWQRRQEWPQIGAAAAHAIRTRHSLQPAEDFAALLAALPTRSTPAADAPRKAAA